MRAIVVGCLVFMLVPHAAEARALLQVRDLLSTSAISATSTHAISFTVTTAVPASGKVVLTPHAGMFTIPASLDHTDIDFAVASGGPFVERDVASVASATDIGVAVVSGTSGSITFTLSSGAGLSAGDQVRIYIGSNATNQAVGDQFITNAPVQGSYTLRIDTQTAAGGALDNSSTRLIMVPRVAVATTVQVILPIRFNGLPSGTISHGNATIELSLNTEQNATCRYATTTAVAYASMTGAFVQSSATLHTVVVGGHVNGTAYNYYVRCINSLGNVNTDDYAISFTLEATPTIPVSSGQTGGSTTFDPGGGGSGSFVNGVRSLYLANVSLAGFAAPNTTVRVLKDGTLTTTERVSVQNTFTASVQNLERGTHTFSVYSVDAQGRESSLYYSTLTLGAGTNNSIANIILPPTVGLVKDTVDVGERAQVVGASIPGAIIEVLLQAQGSGGLGSSQRFTTTIATTSTTGAFEVSVPTTGLPEGTYLVRARALFNEQESNYSRLTFLGIGQVVDPGFGIRADLNKDGKVNLVDFSIMLTAWNTPNANADINEDGRVGLADFSILLFNWTG